MKKRILFLLFGLVALLLLSFIGIVTTHAFWWPWGKSNTETAEINLESPYASEKDYSTLGYGYVEISEEEYNSVLDKLSKIYKEGDSQGYDPSYFEIDEEEYTSLLNQFIKNNGYAEFSSGSEISESSFEPYEEFGDYDLCSCQFNAYLDVPEEEKTMKDVGMQTPALADCFWWSLFEIKMNLFGFNPTMKQYEEFLKEMQKKGLFYPGRGTPFPSIRQTRKQLDNLMRALSWADGEILKRFSNKAGVSVSEFIALNYFNGHFLDVPAKKILNNLVNKKKVHLIIIIKSYGEKNGRKFRHSHIVHTNQFIPDKSCKETTLIISDPMKKGDPDPNPLRIRVDPNGRVINQNDVNKHFGYPPKTVTVIGGFMGIKAG